MAMAVNSDTPTAGAIGTLFAGWQRAGRHVAPPRCDEVAVEADVVRTLYGDPSCRQRAHNTRRHISRASVNVASSELPLAVAKKRTR